MTSFACRFCSTPLEHRVVDLGMSPLCESFLPADALDSMEPFYPLNVWVCHECFLVQLNEYVDPGEIFEEYAYFSSFATTWLQHAADYVEMISKRLELGADSMVVELASNDGYLLKNFVEAGIPCLGIEPAANVAKSAVEIGVPTDVSFFGKEKGASLAADGVKADLVLGNNVMAQVPDLNDFIAGIPEILKPTGTVTIEFPHLLQLLEQNQFDTIYHEHYCYFSLVSTEKIFAAHGLTIFDVEELWTHGGSLRIYARPNADESRPVSDAVIELRNREIEAGFLDVERYVTFEEQARETKRALLEILINAKREGKTVCGYGAPGKGNTLLNYCGIREDFLDFTVDRNPYKHGRFLPGTHIPIFTPDKIDEVKPDLILILPWNFKDEILEQMKHAREWGAQFIVPIPTATVI
ncbi:MAG: class I SAM-dependent methyltransferase [Acidimicrobiales bacterium]